MLGRRSVAVAAAAILAVSGSAALSDPAAASSTARTLKVIQYNLADGAKCKPHGTKCLNTIRHAIKTTKPDVVMLEEVCLSEKRTLANKLPGWTVRFTHLTARKGACGNTAKGQVLAARNGLSRVHTYDLRHGYTTKHNEHKVFHMLCGVVHVRGSAVHACVVHLRANSHHPVKDSAARRDQVKRIVSITGSWRRGGGRVVVAGDFNLNIKNKQTGRPALKPMSDHFVETDRAHNTATHDKSKLDYIWYAIPHRVSVHGDVRGAGRSDHRMLVGSVTFRP